MVDHLPSVHEALVSMQEWCVLLIKVAQPVLEAHACIPSSWEVEARGPGVQGQPELP